MFYQKEDLDDELHDVASLKNKFNDHFGEKYKIPSAVPPPIKEKPKIPSKDAVKAKNMVNNLNNENLVKSQDQHAQHETTETKETFSNLVNRIKEKVKSKNFVFTLMVAGESGLGKSTLVNQLFNCEIYDSMNPGPSFKSCKTTGIDVNQIHLVENKVNLYLNLIDTPGFGENLDNTNCCDEIMNFIEKKYDEYLIDETKHGLSHNRDYRVHLVLYFIQPTGHSLKQLDIEFMKKLCNSVNLVPIIAKADTLTRQELHQFKTNILEDIKKNKIEIYDFPQFSELNYNKDDLNEHKLYKSLIPFAVISSNKITVDADGRRRRVRTYPWAEIDVENLEYSDFIAMKKLIIKYHLLDMVERTNTLHYERYRSSKLDSIEDCNSKPKSHFYQRTLRSSLLVFWNPLSLLEDEKKEYEEKLVKMRSDMEEVFQGKVNKKAKNLDKIKAELDRQVKNMEEELEERNIELRLRREQFQKEKEAFDLVKKEMDELIIANQENTLKDEPKKKEKKKGLF